MKKFHLRDDGTVGECSAQEGNCPKKDAIHGDSPEEIYSKLAEIMEAQGMESIKKNKVASAKMNHDENTIFSVFQISGDYAAPDDIYATADGIAELTGRLGGRKLKIEERADLKNKLSKALARRAELIQLNPITRKVEERFAAFTQEHSTGTVLKSDGSEEGVKSLLAGLKNVQPGTPIAIKTLAGSYIYDTVGDGLARDVNREGFSAKLFRALEKPSFIRYDEERQGPYDATISIANLDITMRPGQISEIHVLKPGAQLSFYKSKTGEKESMTRTSGGTGIYEVSGPGYLYVVNGRLKASQKDPKADHMLLEGSGNVDSGRLGYLSVRSNSLVSKLL